MAVPYTFGGVQFEWDPQKAKENVAKHGVTFERGAEIFADPDVLLVPDAAHSDEEDRHLAVGLTTTLPLRL